MVAEVLWSVREDAMGSYQVAKRGERSDRLAPPALRNHCLAGLQAHPGQALCPSLEPLYPQSPTLAGLVGHVGVQEDYLLRTMVDGKDCLKQSHDCHLEWVARNVVWAAMLLAYAL